MKKYKCIKGGYGFKEGEIYLFKKSKNVYIPSEYEITETTKVMVSGEYWLYKNLFDKMFISIDKERDSKINNILEN